MNRPERAKRLDYLEGRGNYNCACYYYYQTMQKIYEINESNILHSLSKKRQF
jgi:hypothetical protein